jgi:hypothetical protein
MRTPRLIAGFGVIVAALAAAALPARAQSAAQLYPYCAFRAGSTSCYFMTLESCGRSCIANPGYIGETRARALRSALGTPEPASERIRTTARTNRSRAAAGAARSAAAARSPIARGASASSRASN